MSDPFDLLGVEPRFELDLVKLESTHRELSRTLHPDRYVGRPANERRMALSRAIEVNEALRELKDPVRRAVSLLKRLGIELEEGKEPPAPPEFLMEVLELREALTDAQRARDLNAVSALLRNSRKNESQLLERLGGALHSLALTPPPPSFELALPALRLLGELRFVRRFLEEGAAVEDDLG